MTTYSKKFILRWLGKWTLVGTLTGLFLICLLPPLYGWLTGNVIGGLFASFLAKHDTLLWLTEQALGAGYTLLAMAGFDFLFLFMTYMALNLAFKYGGTWKDIAGVALRALKGLVCWQVLLGSIVLIFLGTKLSLSPYNFIPPFLTQSGAASFYMMVWEISLLLFALGYALMEDGIKACFAAGMLGINNWIILAGTVGMSLAVTWIPGLLLSFFHAPTWVLVFIGMVLHTVFFNLFLYVLLRQDDLLEMFAKIPQNA